MKKILRILLIHILAIYLVSSFIKGLEFKYESQGLILTGAALGVASFTVRPVIKILLLPLTLATAGIFSFLANVFTLYIVDYALDGFSIKRFHFEGVNSEYLELPQLSYEGFWACIAFALVISVIVKMVNWLRK